MTKKATKKTKKKPLISLARAASYEEYRARLDGAPRADANNATASTTGLVRTSKQFGVKKSPEIKELFLGWLRKGYTPKRAAAECGIGRATVFAWRAEDDDFREAWAEAYDEGTDVFEDEAKRRAVDGVDRPIFQQGECVGFERVYSDSLMQMMLQGRRPGVYKKGNEDGGSGGNSFSFTFDFGPSQVRVQGQTDRSIPQTVDGTVSARRDLQSVAVRDHRGDDKGRKDRR